MKLTLRDYLLRPHTVSCL